jgi:hypothetical protein
MSTKEIPLCDPYVWEDPRYLFRSSWLDRYMNRRRGVCFSELINEIIFVYVFAALAGLAAGVYIGVSSGPALATVAATIYLIPTFLKLREPDGFKSTCAQVTITRGSDDKGHDADDGLPFKEELEGYRTSSSSYSPGSALPTEGYQSRDGGVAKEGFIADFSDVNQTGTPGNPATTDFQNQTSECVRNPFHNVLVSDIKLNPTRPAAPDITSPERKVYLDEFFRVQWYSDPTDVFGKNQSQREFVSAPVTTIPNDQGSYADWLYRIPGKTCKEGGADKCYGGTEGGVVPWLNNNY